MYRILILGASGFVGQHLCAALKMRSNLFDVLGTSRSLSNTSSNCLIELNLLDDDKVRQAIVSFMPTHIINLAGVSSPANAAAFPDEAWKIHALIPERIGRIILDVSPSTWYFQVSSGLVYGSSSGSRTAMLETDLLQPVDTYGVTKAAGDLSVLALAYKGLKALSLRPFNHIGVGQSTKFAIPYFASEISRLSKSRGKNIIRVGNLSSKRDFLDVHDVVSAYIRLIENSAHICSGGIYNISSGKPISMQDMLSKMIEISGGDISIEVDKSRYRENDIPCIFGSNDKLKGDTGWSPSIDIGKTLSKVLNSFNDSET